MRTFRIFYYPDGRTSPACALIPAETVKQALTRFNAAGFDGDVQCIQDLKFDSNLFNL